jgi:hypothetical protein
VRSLGGKLLVANRVVTLLCLLLSGAGTIGGSALARNQFLSHQVGTEVDYVVEALNQRAATVSRAASFLANDSIAVAAFREGSGAAVSALYWLRIPSLVFWTYRAESRGLSHPT